MNGYGLTYEATRRASGRYTHALAIGYRRVRRARLASLVFKAAVQVAEIAALLLALADLLL